MIFTAIILVAVLAFIAVLLASAILRPGRKRGKHSQAAVRRRTAQDETTVASFIPGGLS